MTKEQVTVLQQVRIKVLNHPLLRDSVEVNQNVATQDEVNALHEEHASILKQVEPGEGHCGLDLGFNAQFVSADQKIFAAKKRFDIPRAVVAIASCLGMRDGAFVQVGGKDFCCPTLQL